MLKKTKTILAITAIIVVGFYLGNASWLVASQARERKLLAHRGLHQTYNPVGVKTMDCTASIIDTPIHSYLENTLSSIQAAKDYGADIVEIDIHPLSVVSLLCFTIGSCRAEQMVMALYANKPLLI